MPLFLILWLFHSNEQPASPRGGFCPPYPLNVPPDVSPGGCPCTPRHPTISDVSEREGITNTWGM